MEGSSTNVNIVGEDFLRAFYTLYQRFNKGFEKNVYRKIIVTTISTNLVTNILFSTTGFRPTTTSFVNEHSTT